MQNKLAKEKRELKREKMGPAFFKATIGLDEARSGNQPFSGLEKETQPVGRTPVAVGEERESVRWP